MLCAPAIWSLSSWRGIRDIIEGVDTTSHPEFQSSLKIRLADEILRESEAFFMKEGKVHRTLKRLARALEEESIPYAIVGGMALNLLGYTRETMDVDILLTPEGLERFRERLGGKGYVPAFAGALKSFRDAQKQVKVEGLQTGGDP